MWSMQQGGASRTQLMPHLADQKKEGQAQPAPLWLSESLDYESDCQNLNDSDHHFRIKSHLQG